MKKIFMPFFVVVVLSLLLVTVAAFADGETPEILRFPPIGISVSPYEQTVFPPQNRAVWNVYVAEGFGNIYFSVTWGNGGQYSTNSHPRGWTQYTHTYPYAGTFSQSWYVRCGGGTTASTSTRVNR